MVLRSVIFATLVLVAVCVAAATHAAQFVASYGTDSAICTRTAPCATVAKALANAALNDTIVCVDSIVDGILFIAKSIDIDCSAGRVVFRDNVVNNDASIIINIPVSANDAIRTVRLRGISLNGSSFAPDSRYVPRGIHIVSAAVVQIENGGVSDMSQQGILDTRTTGQTRLYITDSIVRNNGGAGIVAAVTGGGMMVLDNVRSENNAYGLAAASGNNVTANRSVFSGNSAAGIEGDSGAQVIVDQSTITNNNIGVQSSLSVRLSNNNIAFNNTAISGPSGTFGNNRFSGNGSIGTAPLGGASSDVGQQ